MRIAILAYPGCMGTEIFAVSDVLLLAGHIARALGQPPKALLEVQVVGLSRSPVRVAGGVALGVLRPTGRYDLLVVPGLELRRLDEWEVLLAALPRELRFIQRTAAAGTALAAVCVGTFLLAEAGVLEGRQATTAWLCTEQLRTRYPAIKVLGDAVLVHDDGVITTGAVSSAFDLAIHLVKQTLGPKVAAATARVALVSAPRASQAPFVDSSLRQAKPPSFAQHVDQWLQARLVEPYDLERLAKAFHVSARTLMRRVKLQTGESPLGLLQRARVDRAKQLLQQSTWSLARITEAVGYADVPTFSRLFTRHVGETPARFRRR